MRRSRIVVVIVAAAALTVGAALVRAQSACRGECSRAFQQCKDSCVNAQNFDDCVSDCRGDYEQCLANCE